MSKRKRQTIRATPSGVTRAEKALKKLFGTQFNLSIHLAGLVGRSTIQKFFQRSCIQVDKFKIICETLKLHDWEEIADWEESVDPTDSSDLNNIDDDDVQSNTDTPSNTLELPREYPLVSNRLEILNFDFYIERPPIDSLCQKEIMTPGALLRIKAPPKMGKTLLMSRLSNYANYIGYKAVDLKLRLTEKADFENLDTFLQWFCSSITQMLEPKSDNQVKEHWDKHLGNSKLKCMNYFEDCLLDESKPPLILGLDDVDLIYQNSTIAGEFLGLLRSWHEKAKTRPVWQKLRLILIYTEEYAPLDINHSPFTVGTVVELPEFSQEQVEDLGKQYDELNWNTTQVQQLMNMVGGHPYLVREALEHVTSWDIKLEDLLETIKTSPTRSGIYSDLLQEHLWNLRKYAKHEETLNHSKLEEALKEVVMNDSPVELDSVLATKLYELGLVKLQGNAVKPFCELYRSYFKELLKDSQ